MQYIKKALNFIEKKMVYPEAMVIEGCPTNPEIVVNGKKVISFCSNDYLGMADSEIAKNAAKKAVDKYGIGSGGSRLISGNTDIQIELEKEVAKFKGTEDAITFVTGYMANSGAIPAIISATGSFFPLFVKKNVIFSDELNHASIIDGCRLSKAKIVKYKHKDMKDLEKQIKKHKRFRKMLVTDGVFSMDGDIAPMPEIIKLCKKYDVLSMVDDAHGSGALGKHGEGVMEYFNLKPADVDVIMGTFTKAFGGIGGFITGNRDLIKFLRVTSRTYIFTAPIPPVICASLIASLKEVKKNDGLREKLWKNVEYLKTRLNELGLNTLSSESQIMPVFVGDEKLCIELSKRLLEEGIFVSGVRWPAVAQGEARLRVTVKANHSRKQIDQFLVAIGKVGKELNII